MIGAALLWNLATCVGLPSAEAKGPAPVSDAASGPSYVAMGDSFASGEGAEERYFLVGTSFLQSGAMTTGCHRASTGWAYGVIATARNRGSADSWDFVACSGAVADNLFGNNTDYSASGEIEPPQVNAVGGKAKLVTLSIGGNDAGFADILRDCASSIEEANGDCRKQGHAASKIANDGIERLKNGLDTPSALADPTLIKNGSKMTLAQVYVNVARRMANDGTLIVTGYPRFWAESKWGYDWSYSDGFFCKVGTTLGGLAVRVKYEDGQWMNSLADTANATIKSNVDAANDYLRRSSSGVVVKYAATSPEFTNHRFCSGDKWFNGVQFTRPIGTKPLQTSFHPNLQGQQAYCRAVTIAVPGSGNSLCRFDKGSATWRQ